MTKGTGVFMPRSYEDVAPCKVLGSSPQSWTAQKHHSRPRDACSSADPNLNHLPANTARHSDISSSHEGSSSPAPAPQSITPRVGLTTRRLPWTHACSNFHVGSCPAYIHPPQPQAATSASVSSTMTTDSWRATAAGYSHSQHVTMPVPAGPPVSLDKGPSRAIGFDKAAPMFHGSSSSSLLGTSPQQASSRQQLHLQLQAQGQLAEPSSFLLEPAAASATVSGNTGRSLNRSHSDSWYSSPLPQLASTAGLVAVPCSQPAQGYQRSSSLHDGSQVGWPAAAASLCGSFEDDAFMPGVMVPCSGDTIIPSAGRELGNSSLSGSLPLLEQAGQPVVLDDYTVQSIDLEMQALLNLHHGLTAARSAATTHSPSRQPDAAISSSNSLSELGLHKSAPLPVPMPIRQAMQEQEQGQSAFRATGSFGNANAISSPLAAVHLAGPGCSYRPSDIATDGSSSSAAVAAAAAAAHKLQQLMAVEKIQQQLQQEVLRLLPLM